MGGFSGRGAAGAARRCLTEVGFLSLPTGIVLVALASSEKTVLEVTVYIELHNQYIFYRGP